MEHPGWKIHVQCLFVRAVTRAPIGECEAIIEPGIREETSPFMLEAVGPIAHAKVDGTFESWFVCVGDGGPVLVPKYVSVFVRVGKGEWKEHIQEVAPEDAQFLSESELLIRLKAIEIGQDQPLYVGRT